MSYECNKHYKVFFFPWLRSDKSKKESNIYVCVHVCFLLRIQQHSIENTEMYNKKLTIESEIPVPENLTMKQFDS